MMRGGSLLLSGADAPLTCMREQPLAQHSCPYSQKEEQYTFFFSSLLSRGKIKIVPVMCTKMRDIFAMLLSHLQWHFCCLLQPLSNLLIFTSYFHLDLAEDPDFGGRQVKKKKEKKGSTNGRKGREDPCLCAKQGKGSSPARSASAQR